MKYPYPVVFAIGLTVAVSSFGAEQTKTAAKKKPGTVPQPSKMIAIPPPSDASGDGREPRKLFSSEMSGKDLQFFTTAVETGRFQGYLVELLKSKAASDQIKALGSALSATQEQENKQITRLAGLKGWTVSTEPTTAEKKFGTELESLDGSDFDKAVMDKVIATAQKSVAGYEEASHSADADIKNFAEQMLPLAQEKLRFAEKMTGAGKGAAQLFRKTVPATPAPAAPAPLASGPTPKPDGKPMPPPIILSKPKPVATPAPPTGVSTPETVVPSVPK